VNGGLFVPLHFRSRERKVHRWNFRSRGTFVPWNIRSLELLLLWNFRSSGAYVFQALSFPGTFVPVELSFLQNEYYTNFRSNCQKKQFKAVAIGLHLYILSVLFSGHGVYVLRRLQAERLNAPAKVPWSESSWNIRSCGAKVSRVRKFHRAKVPGLFTPRERMCRGTKSLKKV